MAYLIELDDLRSHLIYPTPGMYPAADDEPKKVRGDAATAALEPEQAPRCRQEELNLVFDPPAQKRQPQ